MTVYINGVAQDGDGGDVGGLYGMNVEVLGGDKTLTPGTDEIYQYLDEGGADRVITLDTGSATIGDRFCIHHNGVWGDTNMLQIKQAAVVLDEIYAHGFKEFIFDGSDWLGAENGTGLAGGERNLMLGHVANANSLAVALGWNAIGSNNGVAIGALADAFDYGVAVGINSEGDNYGVAIGFTAESGAYKYSIALGFESQCVRAGETSININAKTDQESNVVQGRWATENAGGAGAAEMFLAEQTNERFTIRPSSVLAFELIITARDNIANEVARYSIKDGLIKRDGAGNTVMVNATFVVDYEDDAAWDCVVAADDGNDALIITITGDDTNKTQWAAVLHGVETHY